MKKLTEEQAEWLIDELITKTGGCGRDFSVAKSEIKQIINQCTEKHPWHTYFSYNKESCPKTGRIFTETDDIFIEMDNHSGIPEAHCFNVLQLKMLYAELAKLLEHLGHTP